MAKKVIGKKKPNKVMIADAVPDIKATIPDTTQKPALMEPVKDPGLNYHSQRTAGRGRFNPSEYDLAKIGRIEDTDSFVRQAFDKKVALMFKEGWDITGANPKTVKYVKTRLAQIARATGIPTEETLRGIGSALVRKSNSFLVKVRDTDKSGGRVRTVPGKDTELKPVAGYFLIPAETMEFKMSTNQIGRWRQRMPNDEAVIKEWNPQDIVHFYYDRKEGFIFGTPTLIPVEDDVRALRKIEENIELLVYQHLFPLFQYVVGTKEAPAGYTEDGQREVDVVKAEIQFMPTEGGIVTPERHEIKAIGAEGRALHVESYLEHFKKRVYSGLGVSAVDMGEGETANRATADNMSRNLIDAVKDFQRIISVMFTDWVINELLLESTFGPSVLDEENRVFLKFKEIDIDAQIKKEAHYADQFNKDILDHDEARIAIGKEPWLIPSAEDVESEQDTPEKFPQWHRSRWKLFEEPKALIQAIDEPYSPGAKAAAKSKSIGLTQGDNEASAEEANEQEITLEKERSKAKIAVAKAKPKPRPAARKDAFIKSTFLEVKSDIVNRVSETKKINHDWVAGLIRTQMGTTINRLITEQLIAFRRGYAQYQSVNTEAYMQLTGTIRTLFRDRAEHYILKLTENVISSLRRNAKTDADDLPTKVRAVFESVEFRTDFIEDVEIRKAASYGKALGKRAKGILELKSQHSEESTCVDCIQHSKEPITLATVTPDHLPPHHANCNCGLVDMPDGQLQLFNAALGTAETPEGVLPDTVFAKCPKCGKTATHGPAGHKDDFSCKACGHSFTKDEQSQDAKKTKSKLGPQSHEAQIAKCLARARTWLSTRHPDWSEAEVEMAAQTQCDKFSDELGNVDPEQENATLPTGDQ